MSRPVLKPILSAVLVMGLAAAGLVAAAPASAVQSSATLTVTTTADIAANAGACGNTSTTLIPNPLSLREATCLADNLGGTATINIPAGTYTLVNGELQSGRSSGQSVSFVGAGSAATIITANNASRVFDFDPATLGGITNAISGLRVTGGKDSGFGGAGIIAGSANAATGDTLTLTNVVVSGNAANVASPSTSNIPGGGLQFLGGKLTITGSTFTGNSSASSQGSAVAYGASSGVTGQSLSISNTKFSGNTATNSNSSTGSQNGGAVAISGIAGVASTITGSTFDSNTVTATTGAAVGAAIFQQGTDLTVTGSTFTGNKVSGGLSSMGGAIAVTAGTTTLTYNRFYGNTAPSGGALASPNAVVVNAADNWWGCNTAPGTTGCDSVSGTATVAPRLQLTVVPTPSTITAPATSTLGASLLKDSANNAISPSNLGAFTGTSVTFSDPAGAATVGGSAGDKTVLFANGVASTTFEPNTASGSTTSNVTYDGASVAATVTITQAPAITSASSAGFTLGTAGSFTVTTTGSPTPALSETGALPAGVTFTDNGDGTAQLKGTATAGGTFPVTIKASNGTTPDASQNFTLSVTAPPTISSSAQATFVVGTGNSKSITTTGTPGVTSITETGTLPDGLTFTANGSTATISGTPTTGTGGSYHVTLTAKNGTSPDATQDLTITVNEAPRVTGNPVDTTVAPGNSASFTASASGYPAPTVQWQLSTNSGASFTDISGATSTTYSFSSAASDNGNQYRAVFTNSVSSATTSAAIANVGSAPVFTSSASDTTPVGTEWSFSVKTKNTPAATITATDLPTWVTLATDGTGGATLSGTAPVGSGGSVSFTLTAKNGFTPDASQSFTLTVVESATFTSSDSATVAVGDSINLPVAASGGYPTTNTFSISPGLPSGLSLTAVDGSSAKIVGTVPAGFGGVHAYTLKADNGSAAATSQTFTLTVTESPSISSVDSATATVGDAFSFTVKTTGGYPTPSALSSTVLPSGLTLTDNGDGTATISGTPGAATGGVHAVTITADNSVAPKTTQSFALTINESPAITSVDHATATVGAAFDFTVTTSGGYPATPALSVSTLPSGLSFTDNGDGTGSFGGTPADGTGGTYTVTITADNGPAPKTTRTFTLTIDEAPAITSTDHVTASVGSALSFTVKTTAGFPATVALSASTLPDGVTFTDNGDGTASLGGTPANGAGGKHSITITADNGIAITQAFELTIDESPTITSAATTTAHVGAKVDFDVTTSGGYPTDPAITVGTLPHGLSFTDNGDGTGTISGTPTTGGQFSVSISADNGKSTAATQTLVLTIDDSPAIGSASSATATLGSAFSFDVTTAGGYPTDPALSIGALPAGLTFTDNGDGTGILSGTPAAGTGGVHQLTVTADNGSAAAATQAFTLTVREPSSITSAASTTFTQGSAGTFTVTTAGGYPTGPITLGATSADLPAGVSLHDNGDGTATLSGTPTQTGSFGFTITASNGVRDSTQAFTLTVQPAPVVVPVVPVVPITPAPPAVASADFGVSATAFVVTHGKLTVKASRLSAGESYTISVAGHRIASGTASATGSVSRTVTVPKSVKAGSHSVTVVGSAATRNGSDAIVVLKSPKKLKVVIKPATLVGSNRTLVITVSGLAAHEPVRVQFHGTTISAKSAAANGGGNYRVTVSAGWSWGFKKVTATGAGVHRTGSARVDVESPRVVPRSAR